MAPLTAAVAATARGVRLARDDDDGLELGVETTSVGRQGAARMEGREGGVALVIDDAEATYPVRVDPMVWTQQAELTANDGAADDYFGSVSVSGGTALVGAPRHQVGANANQGATYIFVRSGDTWTQQAEHLGVNVALAAAAPLCSNAPSGHATGRSACGGSSQAHRSLVRMLARVRGHGLRGHGVQHRLLDLEPERMRPGRQRHRRRRRPSGVQPGAHRHGRRRRHGGHDRHRRQRHGRQHWHRRRPRRGARAGPR